MADLYTDVIHADGKTVVMSVPGRLPRRNVLLLARDQLRHDQAAIEALLAESDNWTTRTRRGSAAAKTYEELHDGS